MSTPKSPSKPASIRAPSAATASARSDRRARGALPHGGALLVDQGAADSFLGEDAEGASKGSGAVNQLLPEHLRAACAEVGQALTLRMQPGYDHSYFFIATFMEDHIAHHAATLKAL